MCPLEDNGSSGSNESTHGRATKAPWLGSSHGSHWFWSSSQKHKVKPALPPSRGVSELLVSEMKEVCPHTFSLFHTRTENLNIMFSIDLE